MAARDQPLVKKGTNSGVIVGQNKTDEMELQSNAIVSDELG